MKIRAHKRSVLLVYGLLFVLAAVLCVLTWQAWRQEHLLLDKSTSVMRTTNWVTRLLNEASRPTRNFQHAWVSDRQVLYARKAPNPDMEETYEFVLRNLDTGVETPLPGLRQRVKQSRGWVGDETLSPDRQWLLFHCWYAGTFVCRLDGSQYMEMHTYRANSTAFWVGTQGHTIGRVYSDRTLDHILRCTLCDVSFPKMVTPGPITLADTEETELAYQLRQASDETPAKSVTISGQSVRLPFAARIQSAALSPVRDRIALELEGERTIPWLQWLHHYAPALVAPSLSERSVWVLSLQDGQSQYLGRLPVSKSPNPEEETPEIEELQWLPDGRHLSYVFDHVLYTIAVD